MTVPELQPGQKYVVHDARLAGGHGTVDHAIGLSVIAPGRGVFYDTELACPVEVDFGDLPPRFFEARQTFSVTAKEGDEVNALADAELDVFVGGDKEGPGRRQLWWRQGWRKLCRSERCSSSRKGEQR